MAPVSTSTLHQQKEEWSPECQVKCSPALYNIHISQIAKMMRGIPKLACIRTRPCKASISPVRSLPLPSDLRLSRMLLWPFSLLILDTTQRPGLASPGLPSSRRLSLSSFPDPSLPHSSLYPTLATFPWSYIRLGVGGSKIYSSTRQTASAGITTGVSP